MTKRKKKSFSWLNKLGPGLITGAADDDPSGIATYSQSGAQFGYNLLWSMVLTYPLMVAIQLVSARIGCVTGQGLAYNLKSHSPRWLLYIVVLLLLVANIFNIAADIMAMGDALKLLIGGYRGLYVILFGVIILLLQVLMPYHRYVKILKWLTLSLFTYVAVVFTIHISWQDVLYSMFMPKVSFTTDYITTIVAVFGTTISPALFFWQAALEVEDINKQKQMTKLIDQSFKQANSQLSRMRNDTLVGMGVSNIIAIFIMITTAAVLHSKGIVNINTSADAAKALRPVAGQFAFLFFALGIIGTGLLAIPVMAGSAGYAMAEAFDWKEGMELDWRSAKGFYGTILFSMVVGVALDFTKLDPIKGLFWSAVVNGVIAVPIMGVLMVMAVKKSIMGKFVIGRTLQILGWISTAVMGGAVLAMFIIMFKK